MQAARPDREAAIQLRAGESLFVYLKAGTTIASIAGQLCVTCPPRWLGGQIFRADAKLSEGEALQLEGSGWVTLTAARGGSTLHICQAAASSPVKDWLHKATKMFTPGHTARTCA